MKLTVVVTSYNEVKTVIQAVNDAKSIDVNEKEIVAIDNGSKDGTKQLLEDYASPSIKLILQDKNYGIGRSIELGLSLAKGKYTYIQHTDLEYDYRYVTKMLELAEKTDADIVLGSRIKDYKGSIFQLLKERPEYLATIIVTKLINIWYEKFFTDVIGSRLYKTSTIKQIPISLYGPGFDFESISRMCKRRLKMEELAIGYKPRGNKYDKKISWYHMINALIAMLKVRYFER